MEIRRWLRILGTFSVSVTRSPWLMGCGNQTGSALEVPTDLARARVERFGILNRDTER